MTIAVRLACAWALWSAALLAQELPPAPDAGEIQRWVNELGADDYAARTAAEERLRNAGEPALPLLERAESSPDAEVQTRAARSIAFIKTRPLLKRMLEVLDTQSLEAIVTESTNRADGLQPAEPQHYRGAAGGARYRIDYTQKNKMWDMTVQICADGAYVHAETTLKVRDTGDVKTVNLDRASQWLLERLGRLRSHNLTRNLKDLLARTDIRKLREERLEKQDVYVLEGLLSQKSKSDLLDPFPPQALAVRVYAAQTDLFIRRTEILNGRGDILLSSELTGVKLGQPFEDAVFRHTPKPGQRMTDLDDGLRRILRANEKKEDE